MKSNLSRGYNGRTTLSLFIWAALIFGTSCTVIHTDTLYAWLSIFGIGEGFHRFWEAGGGLIVVKGWHFTEFAILFLFCQAALRRLTKLPVSRAVGTAYCLTALFAASDEWHQTFVPNRDGNLRDVVIDIAGATVALLVLRVRERRRTGNLGA